MNNSRNVFLDKVSQKLNKQRPNTPDGLDYTVHAETSIGRAFYNINLRSRGCSHSLRGGCTVCDYWVSRDVEPSRLIEFTRKALENLESKPEMLEVGPSGSMFDDREVPPEVRREIYRLMKSANIPFYAVFTRFDTVTEDKLQELLEFFKPTEMSVDMGLETSDPWKLKYCVNKNLGMAPIISAVNLLKQHHFYSAAYILLGVPFLTHGEMVDDTVSSVLWTLEKGIDYAVIFPVHVKPWTVTRWLYEHNLYEPFSLWALVEVLSRIPPEFLGHVGISWHGERAERNHPLYTIPKITPTTCPLCYEQVVTILDAYRFSQDRAEIVAKLVDIQCECKNVWRQKLNQKPETSLENRVKHAYKQMGIGVLGENWWSQHGDDVLSSIEPHRS